MEMTMQELVKCGIISIEDIERAEACRRQEVLMNKGIETPKITKRSETKFVCCLPRRYSQDGKRRQVVGKTEAECINNYQKIVYEYVTGEAKKATTVSELFVEWLQSRRGAVTNTTLDAYRNVYKNHIKETAFGQLQLGDVKLPECQDLIKVLYHKNLAYGTIKFIRRITSSVLYYGVVHGYLEENPLHNVKINPNICKGQKKHSQDAWTDEELSTIWSESERLWNERKKYRHSALIMLLNYTGCRVGELLAARWSDVDFEKKTLTISKNRVSYHDPDTEEKKFEMHNAKSISSRRTLHLTDTALYWLKEIRRRSETAGVLNDFIVVGRNGRPMDQPHIDVRIKTFCEAIGITYRSSHACRRTYATTLIDGGIPISDVSRDLGHSSVITTQQHYYKLRVENIDRQTGQKNEIFLATVGNRVG